MLLAAVQRFSIFTFLAARSQFSFEGLGSCDSRNRVVGRERVVESGRISNFRTHLGEMFLNNRNSTAVVSTRTENAVMRKKTLPRAT